jgi:hypothetical protein
VEIGIPGCNAVKIEASNEFELCTDTRESVTETLVCRAAPRTKEVCTIRYLEVELFVATTLEYENTITRTWRPRLGARACPRPANTVVCTVMPCASETTHTTAIDHRTDVTNATLCCDPPPMGASRQLTVIRCEAVQELEAGP